MFYSHTVARSLVKLQIKSRVLVLTAIPYTAQMDIFEAMETCRAMRKLKEDPVPYELLEKLIWAATRAPNAGNAQLWNFLVVTDDEGRQFLGDLLRSKLGTGLTQPKDVFKTTEKIFNKFKLKKDADFIVVDFHGEITSEKMAMGHYLDGKATLVVGTHTHVPTSDFRVLEHGTAYQSDTGMCGDYNSVIGMNKENSLKKFFNNKEAKKHFPSLGEATLSGIIVEGDLNTGLAKSVKQFLFGGVLKETN